jgi:hypothetical protein
MSSNHHQDDNEDYKNEDAENNDDENEDEMEEDDDFDLSRSSIFFPSLRSRSLNNSFLNISGMSASMFDMESVWTSTSSEGSTTVRYTPLLSLFENLFSNQLDRLILDEVSSESMQTFHQELLRKNEDIVVSENYPIVRFPEAPTRNNKCFICMDDFVETDEVLVLGCEHLFHVHCIQSAVQYNPKCPLCKTSIEFIPKKSE